MGVCRHLDERGNPPNIAAPTVPQDLALGKRSKEVGPARRVQSKARAPSRHEAAVPSAGQEELRQLITTLPQPVTTNVSFRRFFSLIQLEPRRPSA